VNALVARPGYVSRRWDAATASTAVKATAATVEAAAAVITTTAASAVGGIAAAATAATQGLTLFHVSSQPKP